MIVENVRGAEDWVGRKAKWNFGSFYLWGDVPALMPGTLVNALKNPGHINKRDGAPHTKRLTNPAEHRKNGKDWFGSGENCSLQRRSASGSKARKAASAQIAKIPLALSRHIARVYKPRSEAA